MSGASSRARRRVAYYYSGRHVDSGSPRALLGLVSLLDRSRIDPVFLASHEGPLVDAMKRHDVEIARWPGIGPVAKRHPLRAMAAILRHARLLARHRIDVLHLNELGWNYDVVLAAWLRRIPVVLHVHLPDEIQRTNLHRFAATRVLLVSEAQKLAIGHFERIRDKTDVMYNAVDLDRFASGKAIRSELELRDDDIVVGCLAQLRKAKGVDVLMEAARRLIPQYPHLVFLVAGRLGHGEEEFGRRLMQEAKSSGFDGRFRFLGSRQDVPDLLATFDLFILPTLAETFGIAVVEAMAAGVPVVASRIPAIEEIIASPDLGALIDRVEAESIANAIEEIIRRPDRGRAMGIAGRASLQGRFDRQSLSGRIHEIYDRLVPKR